MDKKLRKTSKFLSYVLRHNPDKIELQVDDHGWANIDELIGKARNQGTNIDRTVINKVVYESEKKRFALSNDGQKIRANYGHSIPVNLDYTPGPPPELLYHGTASRNIDSIREEGIHPGGRQYVHLCNNIQTARSVGQRHGKPAILSIQAKAMHEEGHKFYPTPGAIWLIRHVPPGYIK